MQTAIRRATRLLGVPRAVVEDYCLRSVLAGGGAFVVEQHGAETFFTSRVLRQIGHINTAFVERVNLTIRHHVAAVGRRVLTLCKSAAGLRHQMVLYHTYYNFCLLHASLRVSLALPPPTNGSGSVKKWQLRTPAMAARLTDHVWTLRQLLLFRVPPWPQPQGL